MYNTIVADKQFVGCRDITELITSTLWDRALRGEGQSLCLYDGVSNFSPRNSNDQYFFNFLNSFVTQFDYFLGM